MTPREFRQEKDFEFDHFIELTSTGIKPNYVNIELFAQEYYKAKLNLLTIPVVTQRSELKPQKELTWQCDECDEWYNPKISTDCPKCGYCG